MPPKKAAKGNKDKKKAAAAAEVTPAPPSPEEVAALRAAKAQMAAQLQTTSQELGRVAAERQALLATVAVLEARCEKDAAIMRDMTRQHMAQLSARNS